MTTESSQSTFKCHCADWKFKNAFFIVDEVREKVCRDLPFYAEKDGKRYCVLHYPDKEKAADFLPIYEARLKEDYWDFRMVFFPIWLKIEENSELHKSVDFGHATFAERVNFKNNKFHGGLEFFDAKFEENAYFFNSNFEASVNFNSVEFKKAGDFTGSVFHTRATFRKTLFNRGAFSSVDFLKDANFADAIFLERADFSRAKFRSVADFNNVRFPESGLVKFYDTNFYGSSKFENSQFSEADFSKAKFMCSEHISDSTKFTKCGFTDTVRFEGAEFHNRTDFEKTRFKTAHFEGAMFVSSINFTEAVFNEDAFFNRTKFGFQKDGHLKTTQVNFNGAEFKMRAFFDDAWFSWHTFFDYAHFAGPLFFRGRSDNHVFDDVFEEHAFWGMLSFTNTTVEKPELVYFQTVRLRPSWFVNNVFDLRKVNLIDINWGKIGNKSYIDKEIALLRKNAESNSNRLIAITFRQIADNAESNNRFDEASKFRRLAFEVERQIRVEKSKAWWAEEVSLTEFFSNFVSKLREVPFDLAHFLYRISSYYGENSIRANRDNWVFGGALLHLV